MGYVKGAIYKSIEGNYLQPGISFPEGMSMTSHIRRAEMGSKSCCGWKAQDMLRSRFLGSYKERFKEQHDW